ncbi:protein shank isoform X9 [Ooceraea biroi]|uniref:protein shank isoform X9 n=1 Tax=Ooceraea biroi TaxID=2015173 RepID=UPI0005B852F1|nr:protein shank isoform X9 [Ooceraea biroi]
MEAGPKQQQQQQPSPPQQQQQQPQQQQPTQQQNSPGSAVQPQGQVITGPQAAVGSASQNQGQQNAEDALAAENTPVDEGVLLARIHVPELYVSKCLQFPKDQLVWDVKQQCLASLPKEVATWYRELKESFNYGLFCPPVNGKAGKFLDEERRLGDYPFNGPVGYLELKYKRRVYKMLHLDEKQLKAMHTRTNLRRLLDYVQSSQVEKIAKMCSKGLDPNFHCQETGETPLTLATTLKKPSKVIIALVNGGALLDYRTKEGLTAMHRAVERNSLEAVKTLLELGASPNYKDTKGLTPLYYSVIYKTDPMLCETLLHDHATIGAQDLQGWQEVHQACRNNLVQHLDHLLFYGADMNARNASGNTPLHVCAVNNTDASCIRQLLFRGAQKDALNYANQTPYQVAVIAGNMELAEVIKNYQPEEVDKSLGDTASDVISDSSGVGTSQSDTTNSLSIPGTTVVCVESYSSGITGHLTINQGDILEVTGATDCGLLEGILRGQGTGLFPAHCVQEVRLRHTNIPLGPPQPARDGRNRVLGRRESQHKYFATAPRLKKPVTSEPRTVVLHRSRKGFGFVLRGAKATSPLMELTPSARYPALQYLDDVDQGGVADLAGLRKGDFLIQINGEDVTTASHEHVVDLIRKSGELVRMTVVSPVISLPNSQSAAALPTSQPIQRQYATLPRKGNNNVAIGGTLGRSPAPMPPRRDPKTTLSVGRARARSMVAGLEGGGEKDDRDEIASTGAKSSSAESIHMPQQPSTGSNTGQNTPVQPRTASIRSRPTSSRITAAELEELFQRQQGSAGGQYSSSMMSSSHFQTTGQSIKSHPSSPAKTGRVYASVAEMKRKGKSQSRVRFFGGLGGGSDLHRDFHSTPDLNVQAQSSSLLAPKCHRSQEDVNALNGRNGLPPPNHPPPPPPVGQVVKVNIGANVPDVVSPASVYDNMAHIQQVKAELAAAAAEGGYGVMSSFRPSNSAKLYASPEDMKTVGYRSRSLPAHTNRSHLRKSHSLRNTSNSATFKSTGSQQALNSNVSNMNSNGNGNNSTNNQYAQPLKTNRSHSTAGIRERKKKTVVTTSSSVTNLSSIASGANGTPTVPSSAPPIPEPDYSLSESENDEGEDETDEDGESEIAKELEKAAAREKLEATRETSGNSNTSGSSSSGSGSLPHSFSVEEIQKVRTQLKSSKSHPNDFLLQQTQQSLAEDGDNSSSGVSSDQDVPVGPPMGFDDTAVRNLANQENNQHATTGTLLTSVNPVEKESNQTKRSCYGGSGLLTRHAVSLAQLPPPIEADAEEQSNDLFVPPPPEFNAGPSAGNQDQEVVVFAPPPQFCDNKQQQQNASQNRVKIIGAIPKVAGNQVKATGGRLP